MVGDRFLVGQHPELGTVWAAIDATARFTKPELRATRLGALLAPFPSKEAAVAALQADGAEIDGRNG